MLQARHFRVDHGRIVHETIDGETIMIDLDSGTYFSLSGSGPEIWALLLDGWPEAELVGEMQGRYPADASTVSTTTAEMIERLGDEHLIEPVQRNGGPEPAPAAATTTTAGGPDGHRRFEPPVLQSYTDMQYFLLLDPIHEVTEAGWPAAAEAGSTPASS